jgi:hypothetical protein
MKPELENKLIRRFPGFFKGTQRSMQETCMYWGICCGDGWYDILYMLNLAIEKELKYTWFKHRWYYWKFKIVKAWNNLMWKQPKWFQKKCESSLLNTTGRYPRFQWIDNRPGFEWSQIKEKYGTLRTYCWGTTNRVFDFIDIAERASAFTCEACGKWGEIRGGGRISCLCDKCEENRYGKKEEKEDTE